MTKLVIADYSFDLLSLQKLMIQAGDAIMTFYNNLDVGLSYKEDRSPVTHADLESHRVLEQGLATLTPDIPLVSEESYESHRLSQKAQAFWLADPLDGTRDFLKKRDGFTVNLAFMVEKSPLLGFIYAPVHGALYWGSPTLGSWRSVRETLSSTEPLSISPCHRPLRVMASRDHLDGQTKAYIESLPQPVTLTQAGSSLKFMRLAEGEADVYPRFAPTCEWDTAAAEAILKGAGGDIIKLDGKSLNYGKPDPLNPFFIAYGSSEAIQTHDL